MRYRARVPTLPTSLLWRRLDTDGCDHVLLDDRNGLRARGVAIAAAPLPYTCHYELVTDPRWAVTRVEVTVEGAGWLRRVRLERADGQWRAPTTEQGDLTAALRALGQRRPAPPGIEDRDRLADMTDVDLAAAPLFNTLPVRRLGLLDAAPGTEHTLAVAYLDLPSLEVRVSEQVYTALGGHRVRFASGGFTAELRLDDAGYVTHYPGLADRPGARTP